MDEIEALFKKLVLDKKPSKRSKKPPTAPAAADPLAASFNRVVKKEKANQRAKKGYQSGNGYDYVKVWNDDGSDYKMVPKARHIMAQILGHPIPDHQRVFFRDRTLKGDAKYAPENLILGLKSGVSLDLLTCGNCGCRGNWVQNSIPNAEDRDSAE